MTGTLLLASFTDAVAVGTKQLRAQHRSRTAETFVLKMVTGVKKQRQFRMHSRTARQGKVFGRNTIQLWVEPL
jgi:hypothetical protein